MWLLLVKKDSLKNQNNLMSPVECLHSALQKVSHWTPGEFSWRSSASWSVSLSLGQCLQTCHGLAVPTLYCAGGSRYILRDYHARGCCGSLLLQRASKSRWFLKCTPKSEARDSLSIWAVDSSETWLDSGFIPLVSGLCCPECALCLHRAGHFPLGISTS